MRRRAGALAWPVWLALAAWGAVAAAAPDDPESSPVELHRIDRVVAVVDEDPIFLSDIARARAFNPEIAAGDREILDRLIEERLRSHEVDRYAVAYPSDRSIEEQVLAIEQADGERLRREGIDRGQLESIVRRQLRVLTYVEERLGTLIYITEEAIRGYYEGTFREEMSRRGAQVPPLDEVAEAIETLLREQALDGRIAQWTEELRRRARLTDLLEEPLPLDRLPRSVLRLEPDPVGAAPTESPEPPPVQE